MVALRDEDGELLGYYEKHEFRNKETEKIQFRRIISFVRSHFLNKYPNIKKGQRL